LVSTKYAKNAATVRRETEKQTNSDRGARLQTGPERLSRMAQAATLELNPAERQRQFEERGILFERDPVQSNS